MIELKRIKPETISRAMAKAERYRLLNEPRESISICRDVLGVDPNHQEAIVTLLLSITDLFPSCDLQHPQEAESLVERLDDDYRRVYYDGVIAERWAKSKWKRHAPSHIVHEHLINAMSKYEQAASLSAADNDDALMRWNTCARLLNEHPEIQARADEPFDAVVDEDMPIR